MTLKDRLKAFVPHKANCENCGEEFWKTRSWHRFCCAKCRTAKWQKEHPHISPEDRKLIMSKLGIKLKQT